MLPRITLAAPEPYFDRAGQTLTSPLFSSALSVERHAGCLLRSKRLPEGNLIFRPVRIFGALLGAAESLKLADMANPDDASAFLVDSFRW